MDEVKNFSEKKKKTWISITGYRTLFVLKLLLEKERNLEELLSLIKADNVVSKPISKDTVRVVINTLRQANCVIPRPSRKNNYKYKIISHPFSLTFSLEEVKAFLKFRDVFCENYSWKKILLVNSLFDKIFALTNNPKQIELFSASQLLLNIDKKILSELANPQLINRKVKLVYKSVKCGMEVLEVVPKKFIYENGKLYLECYNFKYSQNSILNVERIMQIKSVDFTCVCEDIGVYEVVYKLHNDSFKFFEKKDNEEIIDKTDESITVKAKVMNEFLFIQRILLFGADFEIISPDSFKEKLINKLKLLKRGYENE